MKCLKSFMEVGTWETKALGGEAYWFQKEVLEMPLGPCARSPPPPPPGTGNSDPRRAEPKLSAKALELSSSDRGLTCCSDTLPGKLRQG